MFNEYVPIWPTLSPDENRGVSPCDDGTENLLSDPVEVLKPPRSQRVVPLELLLEARLPRFLLVEPRLGSPLEPALDDVPHAPDNSRQEDQSSLNDQPVVGR